MKRVRLGWLAFVALLFTIVVPGLGTTDQGSSAAGEDPTRIAKYVASFDISEDGTMRVREVLTVAFPSSPSRHGIFRYFDHLDTNAPGLRRVPHDLTITRDGAAEPYTTYDEGDGRYTVARIGAEQVTISEGLHTYTIEYTIDDVLLPAGTGSRFYWNLVPGGWDQRIDRARLTVRLPDRATDVKCAVEVGAASGCTARGEGTRSLVIKASDLAPRTPVTLSTELALAAPDTGALPWTARWDGVLGDSLLGLWVVLGCAALAGAWGQLVARTAHESTPPYPLLYAPPDGVGPAQAQYVLDEELGTSAFVATMMHAAEQGVVDLDRADGRWTMTGKGDAAALETLDPVTREVLDQLGVSRGGSFVAKPNKPSAGQVLAVAIAGQKRDVRDWALREGLMTSAVLSGGVGTLLVILAGGTAFALALYNPMHMTVVALVPGVFALGCLSLLLPGAGTRRSAQGRDLWSRIGGFRRALATPSSEARFEFAARRDLYTAYLPWAVAFGVADEWAAKYRTEMGGEPPSPAYFAQGYAGSHIADHVDQMVTDFRSTVQTSISAYEDSIRATSDSGSSSGSSGGGGFSGGGGGGGGGGGSW